MLTVPKLLQGYCYNKDLAVVKVFKIAETASKEQGRKIFHELLSYITKEKVYHLAVEKTDRLTRNFKDAVAIDDWLDKDDGRMLHAVKENLLLHKNAKSDVKFMWNIHLAVAKKYTDNLREEAMKGWAEKLAQGWLPSQPPPGYMTVTENGKRIHVPDPNTMGTMQRLFSQYLEPGQSISTITASMKDMGLATHGGNPYARSTIQVLLMNPFYIGTNRFNGKDYPGAQQPIIGRQIFERVQEKLHRGQAPRRRKHDPVFKGLIKCDSCGGTVTWELHKGRYYGKCQRKQAGCKDRKFIREDKVEEVIKEMLNRLVCPSEAVIEWVANDIRRSKQGVMAGREKLVTSIQTQISRIRRMDSDLYDDKLAGEITRNKYQEKHEQFVGQVAELEKQLLVANQTSEARLEERSVLFELSQNAANIYDEKEMTCKRIIIDGLFNKMTSGAEGVCVQYTSLAKAIAHNVRLTRNLIGVR
jgi:site-specific DNA recombinase